MKRLLKHASIASVICLVTFSNYQVAALSQQQKDVIDSGARYFNVEVTPTVSCNSSGSLAGSKNDEKGYNFFVGKGLKPIHAAGIIGNFIVESGGLNPAAFNPGGGGLGAYGIAQWRSGRQEGLNTFAASRGMDRSDLGVQLEYSWQELQTSENKALTGLQDTSTVEDAVKVFDQLYERSGGSLLQQRIGHARNTLTQYGSNTSGTASDTTTCQGGGQIVGGYSLPVDRKWYDENPGWFTKPHHDYPAADIPVPTGTAIYSMTAGRVLKAPTGGDCGTGIMIDAGNGLVFTYCHGSDGGSLPGAGQGDTVAAGQVIMSSASTGHSSGPHLHLQVEINGKNLCPQDLLVGIAEGNPPDVLSLPTSGCTN